MMNALRVGQKAPDFSLRGVLNEQETQCSLSDFLGKRDFVAWFYVYDWTPL